MIDQAGDWRQTRKTRNTDIFFKMGEVLTVTGMITTQGST